MKSPSPCLVATCIYVSGGTRSFPNSRVDAFPLGATGNVEPVQSIVGKRTQLDSFFGIAVDAERNIYVPNVESASVDVYSAGSDGDVAPTRVIGGALTGIAFPYGIALDSSGDLYIANQTGGPRGLGSVTVYAPGAGGNVMPTRTIEGPKTKLAEPYGIAVDVNGDVYVANSMDDCQSCDSITVYASGTTGDIAPIQMIRGQKTGLDYPIGVAVDADTNIYVANFDSSNVLVYAAGSTGNVAPMQTIFGKKTRVRYPRGVTVGDDGKIYSSNFYNFETCGGGIVVDAPRADGNARPIQMLKGQQTKLCFPYGMAIR